MGSGVPGNHESWQSQTITRILNAPPALSLIGVRAFLSEDDSAEVKSGPSILMDHVQ